MCRSCAEGGRRCSRANPTRVWRTAVTERLARNRRVADQVEGNRQQRLLALVERDEALLGRIHESVARYGECVTPHEVHLPQDVQHLVDGLREQGLRPVLVGGSVRDSFDGTSPKDLDFEVYPEQEGTKVTVGAVARAARRFGAVNEVGKTFGVLKMTLPSGTDIDLSVPRRENKVGVGHRGFTVQVDSNLTVAEAAERRDFTVNAMSYDPHLKVLIDPHGGKADLDQRTLRHVSDAFDEDPLRVLRGMQFSARYGMTMDPDTASRCQRLREEAASLPLERTRMEWQKWAMKGREPSSGLRVLAQTGWDEVIPGMRGVAGDERTRAEVDAMRRLMDDPERGRGMDARVMLGAVLTRRMNDEDARAFLSHAVEGSKAQQHSFALSRSGPPPATESAARREALIGPVTLRERAVLYEALGDPDAAGRYEVCVRAGVGDRPEADWVGGADILARTTQRPGPWVGRVVQEMRAAQAERVFADRDGALRWLDRHLEVRAR